MLTSMEELLKESNNNKKAVPQFNINNLEWTKYILETCQEYNNPVILGVTPSAIIYMGGYTTVVNIIVGLMIDLKITIPVVIHLDHGKDFEQCKNAIDAGFTSVMIDASDKSLDENIIITSKVVDYAKKYNVSVEAELGSLNNENKYNADDYTYFIASTGIDALAPSIGNKHGIYKEEPNLNFCLVEEIRKKTNTPLVLHGGSGISNEDFKKLIECGISKININTGIQQAWATGVKEYIKENDEVYDPRKIIESGRNNMIKYIGEMISVFNNN